MKKMVVLLILTFLMSLIAGCSSRVDTRKEIPSYLFKPPLVDINRSVKCDMNGIELIADLYMAYGQCVINLKALEELNGGR